MKRNNINDKFEEIVTNFHEEIEYMDKGRGFHDNDLFWRIVVEQFIVLFW